MSATTLAYSPLNQLTLKPSLLFTVYILLCHGLALVGLWYSAIDLHFWPLLSVLLSVLLVVHGLWRALIYWRAPSRLLSWGEGGWRIDGQAVRLLANHSYYPWLLHLLFQFVPLESEPLTSEQVASTVFGTNPKTQERLILLPDSVTAEQAEALTRLRFWLLNREVGGGKAGGAAL